MKNVRTLIVSTAMIFGCALIQADEKDAKQKMKDALHMRWNNIAENCRFSLDPNYTKNVIEGERKVLARLTAEDVQEVLMRKNKDGKTISEVARSNMFCGKKLADSFDVLLQEFTIIHLQEQQAHSSLNEIKQNLSEIKQNIESNNQNLQKQLRETKTANDNHNGPQA